MSNNVLRARLTNAILSKVELDGIIRDFILAVISARESRDNTGLHAGMRARLDGLIPLSRALAIVADDEASEIPATSGSTPPDEFRQSGDLGGRKS